MFLYGFYGFSIFMSFGKVQAVQPSLPCGQFPQVPLADMAQNDLPAFLSFASFLIINATMPISASDISIVAKLSAKKLIILSFQFKGSVPAAAR